MKVSGPLSQLPSTTQCLQNEVLFQIEEQPKPQVTRTVVMVSGSFDAHLLQEKSLLHHELPIGLHVLTANGKLVRL